MTFKDHFSTQSAIYTQFRPSYPSQLFAFLADQVPTRHHALDTACGNGQAALALADYFDRVSATDASENQIKHAVPHPRITYAVAPAENCGLPDASLDLLTVAQAIHWFDFDRFYIESRRILKPGGLLAVIGYNLFRLDPQVDEVINKLYSQTLDNFWPPERHWIAENYRTLPFPFEEIGAPPFYIEANWSALHVLGYLKSWSAVVRFEQKHKFNPVDQITPDLLDAWGPEEFRQISWPVVLRLGRV